MIIYNHQPNLKLAAKRSIRSLVIKQIAWTPPSQHWIKINTDSFLLSDSGLASCGGSARNHEGSFVVAWRINLGSCTITVAELWSVFWGIFLGRNLGFSYVLIETDFISALRLIKQEIPATYAYVTLVNAIHKLLDEEWHVELTHILKEADRCANQLAKFGHRLPLDRTFFDRIPPCVSVDFFADCTGHVS